MKPCWILCNPRSGSTYLTSFLRNITGFPNIFRELNEYLAIEPYYNGQQHSSLPQFCKAHRQQFEQRFKDAEWPKIEAQLSGLRFIALKRNDLIASSVSMYLASNSNIWFNVQKPKSEYPQCITHVVGTNWQPVKMVIRNLIKVHQYQEECEARWVSFLTDKEHYQIEYNDLFDNTNLLSLCQYLGIQTDADKVQQAVSKNVLLKMDRPETQHLTEMLRDHLLQHIPM